VYPFNRARCRGAAPRQASMAMKWRPFSADSTGTMLPDPVIFTSLVAAGFVLFALRAMATEIDYARRCAALSEEARRLRERQLERLRNLRPRR